MVLLIYDNLIALLKKEGEVSEQAFVTVLEMVSMADRNGNNPEKILSFLEQAQIYGEGVSLLWEMCDRDIKKVFACVDIVRIWGKHEYSSEAMKKHVMEKDKAFFDQFFIRTKGRLL